jgi:photosystem II stability/assembly factor-like uncharacterized protein
MARAGGGAMPLSAPFSRMAWFHDQRLGAARHAPRGGLPDSPGDRTFSALRARLSGRLGLGAALLAAMTLVGCSKHQVTAPEPSPPMWVATSGPRVELMRCLAVSGTDWFVGADNGIYRSTNNGANWSVLRLVDLPANPLDVPVILARGTTVFAGSYGDLRKDFDGLYYSINEGDSWYPTLTDVAVTSLAFNDTTLFAGGSGDGVFRHTDHVAGWTASDSGLANTDVSALAVHGSSVFAGTRGGGVFRSTDNGVSWVAVNDGLTSTTVSDFAVKGASVFAGTYGGGVFRSTDNGASWVAVNNGLTNMRVRDFALSGASLFAATCGGGVFRSNDDGASWSAINNGLPDLCVAALAVSGSNLLAGISQSCVWRYPVD